MPRKFTKRIRRGASISVLVDDVRTHINLSDTTEPSELSDTRYTLTLDRPHAHADLEHIELRGGVYPHRSRDTQPNVGFNAVREFGGLDDYPRPQPETKGEIPT